MVTETRLRIGGAALAAALSLVSSTAGADPAPEDVAAARSLGIEGVKLAESGDCKGAVVKLQAAEKLFHAPTTADRLGECQIALGQIVAGTETLNRVVRETLPASAPGAFVAAQQRAQQALQAALPKIGQLKIHVEGPPADKVTVTVDEEKVSSVLLDSNRPTDPGAHQVKASAPGFLDATQSVTVEPGSTAPVTLSLTADPNAAAATPPPAATTAAPPNPPPPSAPPPSSGGGSSKTLAIVSFVAGGAGIVVGSVFGAMALGTKSTLDKNCPNKVCPASEQNDTNSLQTQATISTIGFGAGIVGAGLGVFFLLQSGGASDAPPPAARGVHVSPWVGIGSAGLGGTFE